MKPDESKIGDDSRFARWMGAGHDVPREYQLIPMRIQPEEKAAIISSITSFDRESEIYLFGSRIDDRKRGGDIDVLVKSDVISRKMLVRVEEELFKMIDEQKIDFVLSRKNESNSFTRMLLAKGAVKIW